MYVASYMPFQLCSIVILISRKLARWVTFRHLCFEPTNDVAMLVKMLVRPKLDQVANVPYIQGRYLGHLFCSMKPSALRHSRKNCSCHNVTYLEFIFTSATFPDVPGTYCKKKTSQTSPVIRVCLTKGSKEDEALTSWQYVYKLAWFMHARVSLIRQT